MASEELKPCFNCGGKDIGPDNEYGWGLYCNECGWHIRVSDWNDEKKEVTPQFDVVKRWNHLWELTRMMDKLAKIDTWTQTVRRYQKEKGYPDSPFHSAVKTVENILADKKVSGDVDEYSGMKDGVENILKGE